MSQGNAMGPSEEPSTSAKVYPLYSGLGGRQVDEATINYYAGFYDAYGDYWKQIAAYLRTSPEGVSGLGMAGVGPAQEEPRREAAPPPPAPQAQAPQDEAAEDQGLGLQNRYKVLLLLVLLNFCTTSARCFYFLLFISTLKILQVIKGIREKMERSQQVHWLWVAFDSVTSFFTSMLPE